MNIRCVIYIEEWEDVARFRKVIKVLGTIAHGGEMACSSDMATISQCAEKFRGKESRNQSERNITDTS